MERVWIKESGNVSEDEIRNIIAKYGSGDYTYVAFFADGFYSGKGETGSFDKIPFDRLLEIRIFNMNMEFMARRSMLDKDFHYRVASDEALKEGYEREKDKEDSYLPSRLEMLYKFSEQQLDINSEKSEVLEKGEKARIQVISSVGGRFRLPVDKVDGCIKVETYYYYDTDGMVRADDFRYCAFV